MPVIEISDYKKPFWLFNRHLETIVPSALRHIHLPINATRERIVTIDDDFLDLDWYRNDSDKIVIVSHGLEGDSQRPYILGMVKKFFLEGWNVLAWNYRGCSGEPNKQARFYHSGATIDLDEVVQHAIKKGFSQISMVGFSLGANLTLKFLGESDADPAIKSAAVFSVPLDLAGCACEIDKGHNRIYAIRFLKSLKEKVEQKEQQLVSLVDIDKTKQSTSVYEFDDALTAPLHGFDSANDYYNKCSSNSFVTGIKVPTLVVNAQNDPFLSKSCYDQTNFLASEKVYFEMPKFGGHVGFSSVGERGIYWSEQRAFDFISHQVYD